MTASRIAALLRFQDQEGLPTSELVPALSVEVQVPLPAERGEFITVHVHSDHGTTRAMGLLLRLVGAIQPGFMRGGQVDPVDHPSPRGGVAAGPVPGDADGLGLSRWDGHGRKAPFHEWLVDGQRIHRVDFAFTQIDVVAKGDERFLVFTRNGETVEKVRLPGPAAAHLGRLLLPKDAATSAEKGIGVAVIADLMTAVTDLLRRRGAEVTLAFLEECRDRLAQDASDEASGA